MIGIIGGAIGLVIGFSAIVSSGALSSSGGVMAVGGMAVVILFFLGTFWTFLIGPGLQAQRLDKIGELADAKIISLQENGSSLAMNGAIPKAGVNLTLEVHPKTRPVYTAVTTTYISMFEMQKYQPGNMLKVKFDPAAPQKILILETTAPTQEYSATVQNASPAPTHEQIEADMNAVAAEQQRLFQVGTEAPATIKESVETKVTVNGDNPVLVLTLHVEPASGPAFDASNVKIVTARTSLAKFQVGNKVLAKYDPQDLTKVTVFRSSVS